MVGLIGAINRFDMSFERKFEAFLVPTVIGEIKRYLRDKTWSVHVPRTYERNWAKNQKSER